MLFESAVSDQVVLACEVGRAHVDRKFEQRREGLLRLFGRVLMFGPFDRDPVTRVRL
jgi:hypothetical protein